MRSIHVQPSRLYRPLLVLGISLVVNACAGITLEARVDALMAAAAEQDREDGRPPSVPTIAPGPRGGGLGRWSTHQC